MSRGRALVTLALGVVLVVGLAPMVSAAGAPQPVSPEDALGATSMTAEVHSVNGQVWVVGTVSGPRRDEGLTGGVRAIIDGELDPLTFWPVSSSAAPGSSSTRDVRTWDLSFLADPGSHDVVLEFVPGPGYAASTLSVVVLSARYYVSSVDPAPVDGSVADPGAGVAIAVPFGSDVCPDRVSIKIQRRTPGTTTWGTVTTRSVPARKVAHAQCYAEVVSPGAPTTKEYRLVVLPTQLHLQLVSPAFVVEARRTLSWTTRQGATATALSAVTSPSARIALQQLRAAGWTTVRTSTASARTTFIVTRGTHDRLFRLVAVEDRNGTGAASPGLRVRARG